MSGTHFRVNRQSIVPWMSSNSFVWNTRKIWSLSDCNETRTNNHLVRKRTLNHLANLAKWLSCVVNTFSTVHLIVCSYQFKYTFLSESTLYSHHNVKELLFGSRRKIWRLSDCNGFRTCNHCVRRQTLSKLVKLAKWFWCVLSTYLYGSFDCMFLLCHVRISEWIQTL